ncbi:MAG TPA: hypothetical protein VEK15_21405 [Vicinamibacteria bacterium]|nr:hypothetical protein [Vicinamibacteria bacterium]
MGPKLTPPPRVNPEAGKPRAGGIGFKTITVVSSLSVVGVVVFALLPRWVDDASVFETAPRIEGATEPEPEPPQKSIAPSSPSPPDVVVEPPPEKPTPSPEPIPETLSTSETTDDDEAFTEAMSEGLRALSRQDFAAAKEALGRAQAMRPGAAGVADALAQADAGLKLQAIDDHRQRASAFESSEDWRQAVAEYDALLGLEPSLRFALEGKERSARRAELAERLDFHIARTKRLSDPNVLEEASRLLAEASTIASPGPRHAERLRKLEVAIQSFSTPVVVELQSDERTEVTIYRVGRLGKFERRTVELRPGVYTVLGSCEGYRDVRRELVVDAGTTPQPLMVRCEERI